MNCVERLTWPIKTIHAIPVLKGKLKVRAMESCTPAFAGDEGHTQDAFGS